LNLGLAGRESVLWAARYHAGILLTRFERFDEANAVFVEFGAAQRRTDEVIQAMGLAALQFPYLPSEISPGREEMVRLAGLGAYEVAARHNPEARKHFQELANRYPKEPNARYVFAAFLLADEPETGIAELKRVLELSPGHVPAKVRLAYEYLQRAEVEPALPYAREAVASAPGSFGARLVLGRLLLEKGDVADAVRELEAARQLSPESAPTRWVLATAYARAGREQEATRERAEGERLRKLQKQ
jgi:predicted Zn-dependent protease